jgi:deoxyribodipyrimidine photolyase-related protein
MNVVFVQADQLSLRSNLLRERTPRETVVILIENLAELRALPFHKQRLIFVLSAMRHFSKELKAAGFTVTHFRLNDEPVKALCSVVESHQAECITLMRSASFGGDRIWANLIEKAGARSCLIENDMFVSNRPGKRFTVQADKSVRMEAFYRKMRRSTGILMEADEPIGGHWNYDKENRKPARTGLTFPTGKVFRPDKTTREVIEEVESLFSDHFGEATPFRWPVTRKQAESLLDDFLENRFPNFGPYQDAMVDGKDTLFHSLLSACLNIGLLDPEEVCLKAEAYFQECEVPLNSVEGFIRQILGWREFVYQLYRANMPGYDERNYLEASKPLPTFYWSGETDMRCLAESIRPVLERGLSHHIQRLMITGNFGLLAGVSPQELNSWYGLAFVDAWHWVVTPNVIGMATFADGGLMASKPYAASANYIHRMSDYCSNCPYNPKEITGDTACPFNALYWDFLHRNRKTLSRNPRMSLSYRNLDRKSPEDLKAINKQAIVVRDRLERGDDVMAEHEED